MDHDYAPGEDQEPLDDEPLCRICGKPRREHDLLSSDNTEPEQEQQEEEQQE